MERSGIDLGLRFNFPSDLLLSFLWELCSLKVIDCGRLFFKTLEKFFTSCVLLAPDQWLRLGVSFPKFRFFFLAQFDRF